MRVLLRRPGTGLCYQNENQWTLIALEAHDFQLIERAITFAGDFCVEAVEVVVDYGDSEITLPVRNSDAPIHC